MLTFISLFAGIGGFDLGLERAGMKCIAQVEIDPYCRSVLAKHWPDVPRFEDVREVGAHNLPAADLICGGFPCQDISNAGKRAGINGERSGLWKEYARIICEIRPKYVVVENVAALLDWGIARVLGDLADCGYDAAWSCVSACAVGAPHMRRRVFIVAYPNGFNGWPRLRDSFARTQWEIQADDGTPRARVGFRTRLANPSTLYGGANGLPFGMDRNRGLGNAVVPQVAEVIGRAIVSAHEQAVSLPPTIPQDFFCARGTDFDT